MNPGVLHIYAERPMVDVRLRPPPGDPGAEQAVGFGVSLSPSVRGAIDKNLIEGVQDRLSFLADQLTKGVLDLDDWHARAEKLVRAAHSAAALAAAGGLAKFTDNDRAVLRERVAGQLAYLQNFRDELFSGKQKMNGFVRVRARMYADAAVATYEAVRRGAFKDAGYEAERRLLDAQAEHCQQCIDAAAAGWQPIGTLPEIGATTCKTRCRCSFEYRPRGDEEAEHVPTPPAPMVPVLIVPVAATTQPLLPMLSPPVVAAQPSARPRRKLAPVAVEVPAVVEADEPLFVEPPPSDAFTLDRRHWTVQGNSLVHIDGTRVQMTPGGEWKVLDRAGKKIGQFVKVAAAVRFVEAGGKAAKELATAFDQAKHPRGQPENKGEFGPGGGRETTQPQQAAAARPQAAKPAVSAQPPPQAAQQQTAQAAASPSAVSGRLERAKAAWEESKRVLAESRKRTTPLDPNDPIKPPTPAGQRTIAAMRTAVAGAGDLSPEQRESYLGAMRRVAGNMPDGAHERLQAGLKTAHFYPDQRNLGEGLWRNVESAMPLWIRVLDKVFSSKEKRELEAKLAGLTSKAAAAYFPPNASLHLDGPAPHAQIGAGKLVLGLTESHVFAHEIGHAIDGPKEELSHSPEWQEAWEAEIKREDHPLTIYATTKREEGFAEFARLLYGGGGIDTAEVERAFPKCTAFFRSRKLWA